VDWRYHLGEDVYVIIKAPQLTNEMCDIFIMCFVLFLFVSCFGWNYNAMAAAAAAGGGGGREAGGGGLFGCSYD
jgi:hypothetical protein